MNIRRITKRLVKLPIDTLDKLVKKTNWYCNSIPNTENYPGDKWYREHLDRNYDIVNIGSSSALFCFDYEGIGVKAFNWALKPQSMEYSYKVLKQYFSILKHNGIVLIPFCPFSGLTVEGKWKEYANDKYFHILDKTLIDNYESVAKRRLHPFRSMPKLSMKRLIKDVPLCSMYSYDIQCKTQDEFERSAKTWINLWMKQFNISNLNAPPSAENIIGRNKRLETVREIINFCLERDLRPVLVIPPVHPSLTRYFTPEFCRNYIYSFIEELGIDGIKVLDNLSSDSFTKNEYFRDAYLMTKIGAKTYTKYVLTELDIIK